MEFSILLPTRNRVELLAYAIESVLRQVHNDWEIIISDNDSEDDVKGFTESFQDSRIKYFRTDKFIPVTENWNNALHHATGDYFIMLGDDDGLLPDALENMAKLIEEKNHPEVIYVDAWQYAYPNVIPGHEKGFIQRGYTRFLLDCESDEPFFLTKEEALDLAKESMSFRISFGFNMQHYFINRTYVERIKEFGEFFQSPYPDYYAANMLMILADSIAVVPEPQVVIGISPKSFGFYYANQNVSKGDAFLKHAYEDQISNNLEGILLPGSSLINSWLYSVETIKENLSDINQLSVDYKKYRFLQIYMNYKGSGRRGITAILPQLSMLEKTGYFLFALYFKILKIVGLNSVRGRIVQKFIPWPAFDPNKTEVDAKNIIEAIEYCHTKSQ